MPGLEFVTRNGLVVGVEGGMARCKTTAKGEEALRHLRELEELMPERGELVAGDESILS